MCIHRRTPISTPAALSAKRRYQFALFEPRTFSSWVCNPRSTRFRKVSVNDPPEKLTGGKNPPRNPRGLDLDQLGKIAECAADFRLHRRIDGTHLERDDYRSIRFGI